MYCSSNVHASILVWHMTSQLIDFLHHFYNYLNGITICMEAFAPVDFNRCRLCNGECSVSWGSINDAFVLYSDVFCELLDWCISPQGAVYSDMLNACVPNCCCIKLHSCNCSYNDIWTFGIILPLSYIMALILGHFFIFQETCQSIVLCNSRPITFSEKTWLSVAA